MPCKECGASTLPPKRGKRVREFCSDRCFRRWYARTRPPRKVIASPLERFNAKWRASEDGCWVWEGYVDEHGYGRFRLDGRNTGAHRAGYLLIVGPIPEGLDLDHTCQNTRCVNPAHLEPVTNPENSRRRRWTRTHCIRGHEYTRENTYISERDGGKRCRKCIAASSARYRARKAVSA